jgi:hypothetical protein
MDSSSWDQTQGEESTVGKYQREAYPLSDDTSNNQR